MEEENFEEQDYL